MPVTYATFSEFTQVYSLKGLSQAEISSVYLPRGALRVNERLGAYFTLPFSSNNQTARELSIDYGYLSILKRTKNQGDSQELEEYLNQRISDITCYNSPMIMDDGGALFADLPSKYNVFGSTADYKNVFDMRHAIDQRVDPDLIDDLWDEDYP